MNKTPFVQFHFAHANGFPAGSYQQMLGLIPDDMHVFAKPQFAHEGGLGKDNNWQSLVDELVAYCEAHKRPDLPLWAVGHSMGGIVSFKACCQRPDLFDGLIMFDPPLITGIAAPFIRLLKKTSYIDNITPASLSRMRKSFWPQDQDIVEYFCAKPLFNKMLRACVEDYVDAATEEVDGGRRLSFLADVETQLFRHIPDDLNRFRKGLSCPGYLVLGADSKVCKPAMYKPFSRHHKLFVHTLDGGHMFPLEYPEETAELIVRVMRDATHRLA